MYRETVKMTLQKGHLLNSLTQQLIRVQILWHYIGPLVLLVLLIVYHYLLLCPWFLLQLFYSQIARGGDSWQHAMDEESDALQSNHT